MVSTVILIALLLVVLVVSLGLWAACLRWGLQWTGVEAASWGRIVLATVCVFAVQTALTVLDLLLSASFPAWAVVWAVGELVAIVLAAGWIIAIVFRMPLGRALKAWLPTLLASLAAVLFAFFVFKPYLYEALYSPTNAMAPTLLGTHWRNVCPVCGEPNFSSPPRGEPDVAEPRPMMCTKFHVAHAASNGLKDLRPDRFLVAKFLAPRRWDIVTFRYPENPRELYCMRLVGLPGERIEIKDGIVWADGQRLEPPARLQGIGYESSAPENWMNLWGTPEMPALLNDDEFFALGDFSAQSSDSRYWHAVPNANLHGVATHIYWPPSRWRVLR